MKITIRHFQTNSNWGDALNSYLVRKLFPNAILVSRGEKEALEEDHLLAIGSIVHWATPRSIIWGTGAILPTVKLTGKPKVVLTVRGPLTSQVLARNDVLCPDVYGDPAL